MDAKLKHLEFIQLSITRMATNSFILKGWSVTLVSALAALAAKDSNPNFWVIALVPCLSFWGLDGYFLRQEKVFRAVYDIVRKKQDDEIDFSMSISDTHHNSGHWLNFVFSKTLIAFHLTILLSIFAVAAFLSDR